jgi:hypothetical protein
MVDIKAVLDKLMLKSNLKRFFACNVSLLLFIFEHAGFDFRVTAAAFIRLPTLNLICFLF